jgi:hypothetical protein
MAPELTTVARHIRVVSSLIRGQITIEAKQHLILGHMCSKDKRLSVAKMYVS